MPKTELLRGTLDMLILRVLNAGERNGWDIAQRIEVLSKEALKVEEGSLYPALYRMEERGWIEWEWGQSENNRKAKFYKLTRAGKKQLETEKEGWARVCTAIDQVMDSA